MDLTAWLEQVAAGGQPRLLINTEGVNVGFHIFEPDGDTVRFVVTNDVKGDDAVDLDIRIDRRVLVRDIYQPFVAFWESEPLACAWRREWRYDDDDEADAASPANKPYVVRSAQLDHICSSLR